MTSLQEALATPDGPHQDARRSGRAPQAFVNYVPGTNTPAEVGLSTRAIPEDEAQWRAEIKRVTGHDIPEDRAVVLTQVRYWGSPEEPNIYCRFSIQEPVTAHALDVEGLIAAVKGSDRPRPTATGTGRTLVVAWADLQVGKVGSRGDSEALVNRVYEKLEALCEYIDEQRCDRAYLVDAGDCVENFENVAGQLHTNDLSLTDQITLARRLYSEALLQLAHTHAEVVATAVPSNHGQWRRGKDLLGKPGDDFGMMNLTAVADAFVMNPKAYGHVRFAIPDAWQETATFDIDGTILGVAHGHRANRPDTLPTWWKNQIAGGQSLAHADILLTGHFHSLRVQPVGRTLDGKRSRWWIQAPTLDNGSDWYRLSAGEDSDPGLLVFTIDGEGWNSLKVL